MGMQVKRVSLESKLENSGQRAAVQPCHQDMQTLCANGSGFSESLTLLHSTTGRKLEHFALMLEVHF